MSRLMKAALQVACVAALGLTAVAIAPSAQQVQSLPMNTIAERYVKLVLAVGQHDADYVDAYYGPPEWKADAELRKAPLRQIGTDAERLIAQVPALSAADRRDDLIALRREYLRRQLEALQSRVRMLEGAKLTFDEESRALYDASAPAHPESYFAAALEEIDRRLPGQSSQGTLVDRYDAFRQQFVIPADRLTLVPDYAGFGYGGAECAGWMREAGFGDARVEAPGRRQPMARSACAQCLGQA